MKTKIFIVVLTVILILTLSGCINLSDDLSGDEIKSYIEREYEANENTVLSVTSVNGDITISTWDGENISLNATKRTRNGKDDLDNAEIVVSENDNLINIEIRHAQPIKSRAVDLDIKIPNFVSVDSVRTTNGPVNIENVKGFVIATTTNGLISLKGTSGVGDLLSTNGGINAEIFDIKENIEIQTTNGGITLYINPGLNASIQISTTNGGINVNGDFINVTVSSNKSFKGVIGNGNYSIDVLTTNGGINIYELEL